MLSEAELCKNYYSKSGLYGVAQQTDPYETTDNSPETTLHPPHLQNMKIKSKESHRLTSNLMIIERRPRKDEAIGWSNNIFSLHFSPRVMLEMKEIENKEEIFCHTFLKTQWKKTRFPRVLLRSSTKKHMDFTRLNITQSNAMLKQCAPRIARWSTSYYRLIMFGI